MTLPELRRNCHADGVVSNEVMLKGQDAARRRRLWVQNQVGAIREQVSAPAIQT